MTDLAPQRLGPNANAQVLNRVHADNDTLDLLDAMIRHEYAGEIALVSSFGAEAAVLLHMVSRVDPATPVLFLETGMMFPETLDYQKSLTRAFGLTDVRLIRPDPQDLAMLDPAADLHTDNTDGCCYLRKTLPLRRALAPFSASISGRKRFQAGTRKQLDLFEPTPDNRHLKINPLANWSAEAVQDYARRQSLPRHPLVARGYPSIGCSPCTSPVSQDEDPRAGRWRGQAKTECGIHFDQGKPQRAQSASRD